MSNWVKLTQAMPVGWPDPPSVYVNLDHITHCYVQEGDCDDATPHTVLVLGARKPEQKDLRVAEAPAEIFFGVARL